MIPLSAPNLIATGTFVGAGARLRVDRVSQLVSDIFAVAVLFE
jgi:hypothetical protein